MKDRLWASLSIFLTLLIAAASAEFTKPFLAVPAGTLEVLVQLGAIASLFWLGWTAFVFLNHWPKTSIRWLINQIKNQGKEGNS